MVAEQVGEEPGDRHDPATVVLGGSEVEAATDVGEGFGDVDAGVVEVASFAAEGGGFTPPQPAVGEHVDQGAVGLLDGVGEDIYLVGIQEHHFGFGLPRRFGSLDRVGCEVAGVDGEGQHGAEDLAGLAHPRRSEAGGLEVGEPFFDGHPVDVTKLIVAEGGQHVSVQVGSVAGEGLGFEMRLGSQPPPGPFVQGGLGQARVGPLAADQVGLDGGHEPLGVDLAGEALGAFPPGRVPVADPPRFRTVRSLLDVRHRLVRLPWVVG
ncbi:hypothetical protein BMS3Bbin01_02817 [bacterium BMS3Bbin01]|nr:hypothetical protein BMS3Bbin01_02817 [bacterium BMS3Bbin01]